MPPAERLARRCATEIARKPKSWKPISHETVRDKHTQKCKGIFYNMEFPWSENTLKEMGPQWLTKAFHAAGTLDERNAVTELILEKRKVTAGNNSGKFLFEVRYKWQTPDLHRSSARYFEDEFRSMVEEGKAIGDLKRLLADQLGCSRFRQRLFLLNGDDELPDDMLVGPDLSHRLQLVILNYSVPDSPEPLLRACAKNRLEEVERLLQEPLDPDGGAAPPIHDFYEVNCYRILESTMPVKLPKFYFGDISNESSNFILITERVQFAGMPPLPPMMIEGTGNQQLDCGMFDLGGFGAFSLHHRLWWGINCAEYALISEHLEEFLSIFLETYRSLGGPSLDRTLRRRESGRPGDRAIMEVSSEEAEQCEMATDLPSNVPSFTTKHSQLLASATKWKVFVLRSGLIITALENMIFMIASIPNCLTMCKSSEWPTIQDRHDPRISADVDGKSTLRTTLQVLLNGIRMLEEMHADEVLDEWISTIFVQSWGLKAKPDEVIFGAETRT
eukprot:g2694.t1